MGGTPARSRWGDPSQVQIRYPTRDRGYPPPICTWLGQQKENSLRGGRNASCVHAGGLSCSKYLYGLRIKSDMKVMFSVYLCQHGRYTPSPGSGMGVGQGEGRFGGMGILCSRSVVTVPLVQVWGTLWIQKNSIQAPPQIQDD